MSENSTGKLRGLKDKLSLTRKKPSAGNLDDISKETMLDSTTEAPVPGTEKYKQLLDKIVINGLLNIAEDKLSDDAFIESVFNKAYELLPVPVRMVLKREWCLSYLQSRKAPLLTQLQLYRVGRNSIEALPMLAETEPAEPPLFTATKQ